MTYWYDRVHSFRPYMAGDAHCRCGAFRDSMIHHPSADLRLVGEVILGGLAILAVVIAASIGFAPVPA